VPDEYEFEILLETVLIVLIWGYLDDYWIENKIDKLYRAALKYLESGNKR
jgi:hypothetical protein